MKMDDTFARLPTIPSPGFCSTTSPPCWRDPWALRTTVDRFVEMFLDHNVDKVVGMESRGFMFGPILAYNLNAGFVPVRKPGKLPWNVIDETYDLEYGATRSRCTRTGSPRASGC